MDGLAVVEKVVKAAGVHCDVPPHSNVAFRISQGTCTPRIPEGGDAKTENIMAAYKLNNFQLYLTALKQVEEMKKADVVRIIFLQIAHAVYHIHKHGWSHGEINIKNLRITESMKNVVLLQPSKVYDGENQASEDEKRNDIAKLSNLYQSILDRSSCCSKTFQHLLMSMKGDIKRKDETRILTSDQLLKHPYFWKTEKKLRFLCDITQRSKEESEHGGQLRKELDTSSHLVFSGKGWFEELRIVDCKEKDKYQEILRSRNLDGTVSTRTVENVAKSEDFVRYSKMSLRSLVHFIRNNLEHFWEKTNDFKACFLFDPLEGYWQFFTKRFPKLLLVVYDIAKQQELKDTRLRTGYFHEMVPNFDLPEELGVGLHQSVTNEFHNGTQSSRNGHNVTRSLKPPVTGSKSYADAVK